MSCRGFKVELGFLCSKRAVVFDDSGAPAIPYAIHSANAYPKLVAALTWFCSRVENNEVISKATYACFRALLRKLGEE